VRHERFDAVIAHWTVPCGFVALFSVAPHVEMVSHGSDVRLLVSSPASVRYRAVEMLLGRVTSWRFVSHELLGALTTSLAPRLAERLERVAVVRPPSIAISHDSARSLAIRAELGSFHVCVARLVPSKAIARAIDHAARERKLLVIVGDGPERGKLEHHAARVGGRVRFVGALPRHEALAYIAAADALVMSSEAEGCSTVAREAVALSTPIEDLRGWHVA
jgi:glycosyltransferase involved in cell wall biosynthesis